MKLGLFSDIPLKTLKVLYQEGARLAAVRGELTETWRLLACASKGLPLLNRLFAQDFLKESHFSHYFSLQAIPMYLLHKMEIPELMRLSLGEAR